MVRLLPPAGTISSTILVLANLSRGKICSSFFRETAMGPKCQIFQHFWEVTQGVPEEF
eukprot:COSAG06_NODE_4718_length_4012_cov_1.906210_2_plen_58_part_00